MRNKQTPLLPSFALAYFYKLAQHLLADALDSSSFGAFDADAQVCLTLAGGTGKVIFQSSTDSLGGDADFSLSSRRQQQQHLTHQDARARGFFLLQSLW